jgi:hypothetical protein
MLSTRNKDNKGAFILLTLKLISRNFGKRADSFCERKCEIIGKKKELD